MEQEEVRALVSKNRPKSAEGYPASVKHAVVTYALTQRAKGARWEDISGQVGLSSTTLQLWCKQQPRFLPVTLTPSPHDPVLQPQTVERPDGLVLHAPNGLRLSGLDVAQAIALLRALS